jgi:hypothetical protein
MVMPKKKRNEDIQIYQMKITLDEIKPPIWRRVQVKSNITLYRFHFIIQEVMGWDDYHLHQFIIDGMTYSVSDPADMFEVIDEETVTLSQVVFEENTKFIYEYDFGDSWSHIILVEKILPFEADKHYPVCLKGKRACPPEDCGGPYGYDELLEILKNPKHPEHEEMVDWLDYDFDPEYFDLDEINERLARIK